MLERTVITTTGARLASALCRTSRGRSSAGVGAARWHWIARRRDRASLRNGMTPAVFASKSLPTLR